MVGFEGGICGAKELLEFCYCGLRRCLVDMWVLAVDLGMVLLLRCGCWLECMMVVSWFGSWVGGRQGVGL